MTADSVSPCPRWVQLIPRDFARSNLVLGVAGDAKDETAVVLVAADPPPAVRHNLRTRLGVSIRFECIESADRLAVAIDQAYATETAPVSSTTGVDSALDAALQRADRDLLATEGKSEVVQLVDALLLHAVSRGASDLHLHPGENTWSVRYRLDGALATVRTIPANVGPALIARIKVMARMDVAERRVPQDGRSAVTLGAAEDAKRIELRVSTIPTRHGERAVLRLLGAADVTAEIDALGMTERDRSRLIRAAQRPEGVLLVTGPTGHGKSTTLYALLRAIATPDLNTMTIEDPIEYELDRDGVPVSQSQVERGKGMTFASGLRHLLRQDPDVIMVGEIRDHETASIVFEASMTGHRVFSTLHTNDAVSAPGRLADLGIEPYSIASALVGVLAQRLVRLIHAPCSGSGCEQCLGTGMQGRTGVFELLLPDEAIRAAFTERAPIETIRRLARDAGMSTLADEGSRLVKNGLTTPAEVERVLRSDLE